MPYDRNRKLDDELMLLLSRVKGSFIEAINGARAGANHERELKDLAQYCLYHEINCITYNYDDTFDQALYSMGAMNHSGVIVDEWKGIVRRWNPDNGYGFKCDRIVPNFGATSYMVPVGVNFAPHPSSIKLFKLHGSMNWRVRMGAASPYDLRSIVHYEDWKDPLVGAPPDGTEHLEPEPFIVPPVLAKPDLVEQPILRYIWSKAYDVLTTAEQVIFLGYSFPTPMWLQARIEGAYRRVFPDLKDSQFEFGGALEWSKKAIQKDPPTPIPPPKH
jgi:hypothetical protein